MGGVAATSPMAVPLPTRRLRADNLIKGFFGSNALVAIVVLALITIFLFREGFGLFGQNYQLRENFTIVIVTHNMQQPGRCSNYTGFFYLGRLIEFGATSKIFSNPSERKTEDYITGRFG